MKILTAMIYFEGENGLHKADTIEKDGKYWLVPYWLGNSDGAKEIPVRLICISSIQHQVTPGSPFGDIILNAPIPRAVFEGRAKPTLESGLVVIENEEVPGASGTRH